jgi:dienelactone hydrolase
MEQKISLPKSELLLVKNATSSTETVVLFLPGISGGAFSERFQSLVDMCIQSGFPIARMQAWESSVDVDKNSWNYYHEAIRESIDYLRNLKYKNCIAVGKSFGGGLLLSYHNDFIRRKILWAPACGVGENDTLDALKDTALHNVATILDVKVSNQFIHDDPSEVCIIHGTNDNIIPIANSRMMISSARRGSITEIAITDHSFTDPKHEQSLIDATQRLLVS